MTGGVGNPLIVNDVQSPATNVNPTAGPTPNGAEGRIVLAVPNATGNAAEDPIYGAGSTRPSQRPTAASSGSSSPRTSARTGPRSASPACRRQRHAQAIPTNDVTQPNYPITGDGQFTAQGNYDLILTVDPTNPNVVYLGGSCATAARPRWPASIRPTSGTPTRWSPIPTSPMTAVRSICPPPARPPSPTRCNCASLSS